MFAIQASKTLTRAKKKGKLVWFWEPNHSHLKNNYKYMKCIDYC